MKTSNLLIVNAGGYVGTKKPASHNLPEEKLLPTGLIKEGLETNARLRWEDADKLFPIEFMDEPMRMQNREDAAIERLLPIGMPAPRLECD